jgi:hypothetical protein
MRIPEAGDELHFKWSSGLFTLFMPWAQQLMSRYVSTCFSLYFDRWCKLRGTYPVQHVFNTPTAWHLNGPWGKDKNSPEGVKFLRVNIHESPIKCSRHLTSGHRHFHDAYRHLSPSKAKRARMMLRLIRMFVHHDSWRHSSRPSCPCSSPKQALLGSRKNARQTYPFQFLRMCWSYTT